jgi:hypothetical protein
VVRKSLRAVGALHQHILCLGRCNPSAVGFDPDVCGVYDMFDIALIAGTLSLRVF